MNYPMELLQMIKSGKNPQQLMLKVLENRAAQNNPMFQNLLALAKDGNTEDIEQIARNLSKERGIDFDKEFNAFKKSLGL